MSVIKKKLRSGALSWGFVFDAPGSSRLERKQIREWGYETKRAATEAEAARIIQVRAAYDAAIEAANRPPAPPPQKLQELISAYLEQQAERHLEPKTAERYRQSVEYFSEELLETHVDGVTPYQLTREWNRLVESGGHHRKTKESRPLSAKSVRNIAGVLSSVFKWACGLNYAKDNPVRNSTFPRTTKRPMFALTVAQQDMLLAASAHSQAAMLLQLSAASGARRGEVLALRWSDLVDNKILVTRSLAQTKRGLAFKATKTVKSYRDVELDPKIIEALKVHCRAQQILRKQFGPDYRVDLDLILANPDGTPIRPDSMSAKVSALCRRLDLPKRASLHTLRHTHASHLLAGGADIALVSQRLGHANTAVTAAVYSHAIKGRDHLAVEILNRFQENERGKKKPIS